MYLSTSSCRNLKRPLPAPIRTTEALEAPAALPEVKPTLLHVLSNREIEILTYALAGHLARDTSSKLGITKLTVHTNLHNIHKKARALVGGKEKNRWKEYWPNRLTS